MRGGDPAYGYCPVLAAHPPGLVLIVAHMGLPEYAEFLDLAAVFHHNAQRLFCL